MPLVRITKGKRIFTAECPTCGDAFGESSVSTLKTKVTAHGKRKHGWDSPPRWAGNR